MKSLGVSLVLLCLIFSVAAVDSLAMHKGIKEMESIYDEMAQENRANATLCGTLREVFQKYRWLFSVSVQMEVVDGMENTLLLLESALKNESAAEYSTALVSFRYALYRLRDAAIPSPETVF